jgi:Nucleotidyltransferase
MPGEGIRKEDLRSFARLVDALAPWLDQVVIIGGWAQRLYRIHPLAQPLDYDPLATFDTDVAMPAELPEQAENMRSRLAASGFEEELLGDMRPPVVHYRLTAGNAGFYAEFLTPLIGAMRLLPLPVYPHKSCAILNCFWPRLGKLRSARQQGIRQLSGFLFKSQIR